MAPSTFASAAAGNPQNHSNTRDSPADWSRRTNGATQTFRRPSGAAINTTSIPQNDGLPQHPPRYVPPHRNGTLGDTRYAKEQLLDLYRSQISADIGLDDGLAALYVGGWHPDGANGASVGWGRAEHNREAQPGPDVCWLKDEPVGPVSLLEMDDEERELFSTSVNTPIKLPLNATKDNQQANGMPSRKVSISGNATTPGGFGLPSPSIARGPGRRRETGESFPFPSNNLASPSNSTFNKDEQRTSSPPPSLLRRRTDLVDHNKPEDREKENDEKSTSSPFGTLKRHPTGPLSAGFGSPASPWGAGPPSGGLPPMGSFGNFGLAGNPGQQVVAGDKRPGLGGGRSESRFKNLLSKDSSEDIGNKTLERKTSISSLPRVNENESWRLHDRTDPLQDPLVEAEEDFPTGSAALAADTDVSPPHARQGYRSFGTPSRQSTQDDFGFGAFGMTSDNAHGFAQGFLQGREAFQQTPSHQRTGPSMGGGHEPMSPTDTNPYQSPEQHGIDRTNEDFDSESELSNAHLPGLGGFGNDITQQLGALGGLGALPHLGRSAGNQGPGGDRSQTSSVGPNRGFPGLGGFGSLGGMPGSAAWPVSQGGLGTPGRQTAGISNAFGNGLFSPVADAQPSGLAGLGGAGGIAGQHNTFGNRMAGMFPSGMQDQLRQDDRDLSAPGAQLSKLQQEQSSEPGQISASGHSAQQSTTQDPSSMQLQQGPPGSSASNQPPAPQQRTMVMPDRMRWIYRDPQGQTQGPWSGLEMHDWYKAGFFSPELLVKKYEDPEYEPLAQLIRRIGNSREPFLVPQIGIPHGAPSNNGPNAWAGAGPTPTSATAGGAQPPFASSFPSFGTTLTADQQNALERRKQEEQYLMARQKEHLAQAQIAQRIQMQGGHGNLNSSQLHHHSSAHSLQSQPSFGSITSPNPYQPSPNQGPSGGHVPGFFDNSFRSPGGLGAVGAGVDSLGHIREEEIHGIMDRLNISDGRTPQNQFGAPGQPSSGQSGQDAQEQQIQQMLQDRARLQQEQIENDGQQRADEQIVTNDRLQEFQQLQGQTPAAETLMQQQKNKQQTLEQISAQIRHQPRPQPQEPLSLTEQVQKAASAQQSPAPRQPGLPQPFPPPPSQSPLPAPAAQRTGRQSVADQLQTESRDLSQTPSVETPSAAIAPWAKEPAEALKGPSLREIQEAEAKKAAETEALAAAVRRAAFERQMEAQAAVATVQPGLPAGSTWATGSPATPTGSTPAAWAKTTQKASGPAAAKSMAQIQKEEEARKRKLVAATAAAQVNATGAVASPIGGKSYANLAGKVSAIPAVAGPGIGAWTTVGAGGKTKSATPAPAGGSRTASAGVLPTIQPVSSAALHKPPTRSSTLTSSATVNAQEEFRKWAVSELRPDLNKGINADDFVASLVFLPPDSDIITEAVHGSSNTMDSRHFAEEFIRKKKLADKGIVDVSHPPKSTSPTSQATAGWSEVAKKGPSKEPAKEEPNGNFRVVAAKKKGGKR